MEREKRLMTAGVSSRHSALLRVLEQEGYTLHPPWQSHEAEALILPMPYSADGRYITGTKETLASLLCDLKDGTPVLGGRFDKEAYLTAARYGARLFDYFTPEEVQIANAALTAKGALCLARDEIEGGGDILVCGFGRIGKLLMHELSKKGVAATVSLRKATDGAWAQAMGYRWVNTRELDAASYDLIFNTVPAVLFGEEKLKRMKAGAHIIDLASPPYGVDYSAAERLGKRVTLASALPGRMYPEKAGEILGKSALEILRQVIGT